jgi:hypothetical protein
MKKIIIIIGLVIAANASFAQTSSSAGATNATNAQKFTNADGQIFPMTAAQYEASKTALKQKKAAEEAKAEAAKAKAVAPQAPVSTKGTSLEVIKPNGN